MVVDDHTLFRKGLIAILSDIPEIEIVGEAENGKGISFKIFRYKSGYHFNGYGYARFKRY